MASATSLDSSQPAAAFVACPTAAPVKAVATQGNKPAVERRPRSPALRLPVKSAPRTHAGRRIRVMPRNPPPPEPSSPSHDAEPVLSPAPAPVIPQQQDGRPAVALPASTTAAAATEPSERGRRDGKHRVQNARSDPAHRTRAAPETHFPLPDEPTPASGAPVRQKSRGKSSPRKREPQSSSTAAAAAAAPPPIAPIARPATTAGEKVQPAADVPSQDDKDRLFLNAQLDKRRREKHAKHVAISARAAKSSAKRSRTSRQHGLQQDTFQTYMEEISRSELLAQSEVVNLASQIRDGLVVETVQRELEAELGRRPSVPELAAHLSVSAADVQKRVMAGMAAKNSLVAANLRLVISVARKVAMSSSGRSTGIAFDDMVQEGSVGLIRAAEKFDASRGYHFSTYATWWIRAYVLRSITTQSRCIKVPATAADEYAKIKREFRRLQETGNFSPSDEQVAKSLGITAAKLRFVVSVVTRVPFSLDRQLSTGAGGSPRPLSDVVKGDDNVEEKMVIEFEHKELDKAMRTRLRPLERAVIRLRFGMDDGQPRTLRETGAILGLSKERIRQIVFRALPKLKTPEIQRMLTTATAR